MDILWVLSLFGFEKVLTSFSSFAALLHLYYKNLKI